MAASPKKGPRSPRYYQDRIDNTLKSQGVADRLRWRHQRLKEMIPPLIAPSAYNPRWDHYWKDSRRGDEYEDHFKAALQKAGLGESIKEALAKIPRGRDTPLRILELGPGKTNFVRHLREDLEKQGIPTEATAVDMFYKKELGLKKDMGHWDDVVPQAAELYIPDKQHHVIIDMFGPINYTIRDLRTDTFLKYAHSLPKKGVMLFGFEVHVVDPEFPDPRFTMPGIESWEEISDITNKLDSRRFEVTRDKGVLIVRRK